MIRDEHIPKIRTFTSQRRFAMLTRIVAGRAAVAAFVYLLISAALAVAFSFFPWTLLPVAWMVATVLALIILLALPAAAALRKPSLIKTAKTIESKSGLKHPTLSLALELSEQPGGGGSAPLRELTYKRAADELKTLGAVKFPFVNKRVLSAAAVLLAVNAAVIIVSPDKITGYWKLPLAMIAGEQARVTPGSVTVPLNSSVPLALTGAARRYPTARLETWPLEETRRGAVTPRRHFLRADSSGDFSHPVDNIRESFVYQFSLSSALAPETVTVVPPPLLRSLSITLTPPRYTKLPPRELPAGQGNITAYPGTAVGVSIESGALNSAGIIIGGRDGSHGNESRGNNSKADTVMLDVAGKTASGTFTVNGSSEYTFFLVDTLGQASDTLPRFMISALPDEPPIARILRPGQNKALSTAQVETLWVEGIDDFGIGKMELRYRRAADLKDAPREHHDLSEKGSPPLIRKPVVWNIRELGLYPGDTLFYWLWVRDNKPFGRVQSAASDTFWFRMPSFEEIHKAIAEKEQYAQEKLGEVRTRQDNISHAVDRLVKSATGQRELTWDQKRVIDDVKEQLKAQADSLQKAFEALEQGLEALREDGKLDEELFAKMEQIKKSVEELMKEFGEKLFKIDTDQQMTMSDMRQAANNLKNMLPELSERLDHTLAFLERLRQEKELADLAVRAENLAGEQSELADAEDSPLADRRQQDLLDRIDGFNKEVGEFFKQRSENSPPSSKQVGELSKEMRRQQQKPSGGDKESKDGGDKKNAMSRELMSLSEQLKSNLMVNMMAKIEEDRRRVLSMAHDALSLEEWQRLIRFQALGTADDRGVAFAQQALGNAIRVSQTKADSLTMVDAEVIRGVIRAYRDASAKSAAVVSSLNNTDGTQRMDQSMRSLRELANILLSITGDEGGDGEGGGGMGGMMASLRRASGRQAALNSMMGDLLQSMLSGGRSPGQGSPGGGRPQGQGYGQRGQDGQGQNGEGQSGQGQQDGGENPGGQSGGGGGEAETDERRQAREAQQAIAEELKRIADAYGKEAGRNMENRVRELEQEARRLAQLLENPPADIIDQQDRFLSRMLQSTLSMNRKDEGKEERKGSAAQAVFTDRAAAPPPAASSRADSFHLLRRRAFEDNFPEEYRSAIREYFDALGEMEWDE